MPTDAITPPANAPLQSLRAWLWPAAPASFALGASPARDLHIARARAASAVATRCLSDDDAPDTPVARHAAMTAALSSWRDAAYCALLACAREGNDATDLTAALRAAHDAALTAAGTPAGLVALHAALTERAPAAMLALDESTLRDHVQLAESFVRALLDGVDDAPLAKARRLARRASNLGVAIAVVGAIVALAPMARRALRPELARNAPWHASSAVPEYEARGRGFHPIEGGPNIFFHTQTEAAPWIVFDLGAGASVESVWVQNRLECCTERAVPLVVECSDDELTWREVARRNDPYYYWTATFPRTSARYVRLRVPRETVLHLGAVEMR